MFVSDGAQKQKRVEAGQAATVAADCLSQAEPHTRF